MDCSLLSDICVRPQLQLSMHYSGSSISVWKGLVIIKRLTCEVSIPKDRHSGHTKLYPNPFFPDCIDAWDLGTGLVVSRNLAQQAQQNLAALSSGTHRLAVSKSSLTSAADTVSKFPRDESKDLVVMESLGQIALSCLQPGPLPEQEPCMSVRIVCRELESFFIPWTDHTRYFPTKGKSQWWPPGQSV